MHEKLILLIICLSGIFYSNAQHGLSIDHLKFIENKGQWNENIRFKADIPTGELIIQKDFIGYILRDEKEYAEALEFRHGHFGKNSLIKKDIPEVTYQAFKVKFVDINESVVRGVNSNETPRNYLIGNDKSKWAKGVKAYGEIQYLNVYQGIDFHLFSYANSLKYEFEVTSKSDPSKIVLEYEGVNDLRVENDELVIETSVSTIREKKPFAYQVIKGKRVIVECAFQVHGKQLTFKLGDYKNKYPLVIDPQLIFSTYSGSTADNWGNTACLDNNGNLYTGGTIFPNDGARFPTPQPDGFPATNGAFQTTFQGGDTDIGILKFDSSGTQLLYATYIGGNDAEIPTSLITNDKGELFILGISGSTDFPVTKDAFDTTFNGGFPITPVGGYVFENGTDIVVLKLSADGSNISASTYLGGHHNDGLISYGHQLCNNYGDQLRGDINIDEQDNIYIVSTTESYDFPVKNAFQGIFGGDIDAVVTKLNSDVSDLIFSSFLGKSGEETGMSIVRDSLDNVLISGGTTSLDFHQTDTLKGYEHYGNADGYVVKIKSSGDSLLHSLKIGTPNFEQIYFIQSDNEENIYVLGQTKGDYPITSGVYNDISEGVFIHKFSKEFDSTYFSTTLGDTVLQSSTVPNFSPTAFLVNDCENIFIAGWGGEANSYHTILNVDSGNYVVVNNVLVPANPPGSGYYDIHFYNGGYTYNLPVSSNAFQKTSDGSDFYMMVLHKDADSLLYATYFGGPDSEEHVDGGTSRFDKQGIVYQSVCAGCGGNNDFPLFPTPDNNPDTYPKYNNSSNCNNGVFKYDLANLKAQFTVKQVCDSLVANFQNTTVGGVDFYWDFGDGKDTVTYKAVPIRHRYNKAGTYKVKLIATDLTTCIGKDSMLFNLDLREAFVGKALQDTICQGDSIQLSASSQATGFTYDWFPKEYIINGNTANPTVFPDSTKIYYNEITDDRGCIKTDTHTVYTTLLLDSIVYNLLGSCVGLPSVQFQTKYKVDPTIRYHWNMGDGTEYDLPEPLHKYKKKGKYTVTLEVNNQYCYFKDISPVDIMEVYIPNIFTPNNDGTNDFFEILGIENNGDWKLEVYNRWGKSVFVDETYSSQWNGGVLEDATYYYLLTSPDGATCKGWVQIVH